MPRRFCVSVTTINVGIETVMSGFMSCFTQDFSEGSVSKLVIIRWKNSFATYDIFDGVSLPYNMSAMLYFKNFSSISSNNDFAGTFSPKLLKSIGVGRKLQLDQLQVSKNKEANFFALMMKYEEAVMR